MRGKGLVSGSDSRMLRFPKHSSNVAGNQAFPPHPAGFLWLYMRSKNVMDIGCSRQIVVKNAAKIISLFYRMLVFFYTAI